MHAVTTHCCLHRFNKVFEQATTQDEIFENVARGVIDK